MSGLMVDYRQRRIGKMANWTRDGVRHIELEGCILNIREGLSDRLGRKVTSIEILPDDHFAGEQVWRLRGHRNNRVVQLKKKF
jgi:hypothetical protein